jgi:hypothetical protein
MELKDYHSRNLERISAAADWLLLSIRRSGSRGSAASYSPVTGWSKAYPETTGYVAETLIRYGQWTNESRYTDAGVGLADWLMEIQNADGSFPAGLHDGSTQPASTFNTAQTIFGLLAADALTGKAKYVSAAQAAASWLARTLNPQGLWLGYGYGERDYSPVYYSRVAWPLLLVWQKCGDERMRQAAVRALDAIIARQNPNGTFRDWGFRSSDLRAFTHTIAYTVEGLLESALALEGAKGAYWQAGLRTAEALLRRVEIQKRIAGMFDQTFKGTFWFTCITGNCQLAVSWLIIAAQFGDLRYLNAALKILDSAFEAQRYPSRSSNLRGALPGSQPVWGRYMTLRYPNWAAKFFIDAVMKLEQQMSRIESASSYARRGDCGILVK